MQTTRGWTKGLAWFLALVLCLGLLPVTALATGGDASTTTVSPWDGVTVDTSWYNTSDTSFAISTAAQLAGLTAIVAKTSAGAVSYLPVARVANLTSLLKELKKEGLWVFGTAADGNTSLYDADLKGPAVIVIGSEGDGMGRLVREQCDFLVSIPMRGRLNSLNASAAAAVVLYEAVRQRG